MASVTLDEIIDAFLYHKPELKAQEIKDYVFKKRGSNSTGYKHRYSFDNTIQRIIEKHCPTRKGYNGRPIFQSVATGYYKLIEHSFWAEISEDPNIDTQILNLSTESKIEDLELTTRTLREVNIINRNKNLVQNLKILYANTCQLCGTQLKITENIFYSEVHHIKSLGEPHNGPDTVTNMIVVCPNCHVLLDFNSISIYKEILNLIPPHDVENIHIEYHNKNVK